jgi:hypothetical protein
LENIIEMQIKNTIMMMTTKMNNNKLPNNNSTISNKQ